MYMSYCRFEGTLHELRSCLSEVNDHVSEEAEYKVSDHEIRNFRTMVKEFTDWILEMDLLDENGYLDDGKLDDICECMAQSYSDGER